MIIKPLIRSILPFRFLSNDAIDKIAQKSSPFTIPSQEFIIKQGDKDNLDVFLIIRGHVEVLDTKNNNQRHTLIEQGNYVGEWEPIFDVPRVYSVRALTELEVLKIPEALFIELFRTETAFRLAFSALLRDIQGIFNGFELFRSEILSGIGFGHFRLNKLLPLYLALKPALHSKANAVEIDFSALEYAIRRLPNNVGSTFGFLIRDELPSVFEEADLLFKPIPSDARRRAVWEVMPGKDLITVRSGVSDIMDFITCLCVYAVEARKIRKRLYAARAISEIKLYLEKGLKDIKADALFIGELGFSAEEVKSLMHIWPKEAPKELWHIINHREMFSIDIRRQLSQYNLKSFTKWSRQISDALRVLTGKDPKDLNPETEVHIISSNTHSIANCLNPWFAKEKENILAWAREKKHPSLKEDWEHEFDLVYALTREFLNAHPEKSEEMKLAEANAGILRLSATASTGIEVQIIDTRKNLTQAIDSALPARRKKEQIIINIDYAFGEQAEDILQQLVLLFGKNVFSVNFLGKAGALCGKRGDILLPNAFLDQSTDTYQLINQDVISHNASLENRLKNQNIHLGPMLTVQGTLLQNRDMLNFYRKVWDIRGIEMEGFYYHRQTMEARDLGYVRADMKSRFIYYVSDLPLDTHSNLSKPLASSEGIPPLYAISREILAHILE